MHVRDQKNRLKDTAFVVSLVGVLLLIGVIVRENLTVTSSVGGARVVDIPRLKSFISTGKLSNHEAMYYIKLGTDDESQKIE